MKGGKVAKKEKKGLPTALQEVDRTILRHHNIKLNANAGMLQELSLWQIKITVIDKHTHKKSIQLHRCTVKLMTVLMNLSSGEQEG